jgi:uncharacterized protein YbjT (DUF2867 family)
MLILVTGATGYIASRLIPQLLDRGYTVRALARRPHQIGPRNWSSQISIFPGDVMDPKSLAPALKDVHTAYYLIHNMSSGRGYTKLEIQAAHNFALAAEEAGVQHIIYLGGLADPEQHIAPHLRSRIETGATLRQGKVPVTEFRAGVITGSGSISFEMIRFMTELFPLIPAPVWLKNKSQPIAVQNVMDYLLAALEKWDGQGRVLEIGGPEIITYQDLMLRYARIRGHKRRCFLLPYVPVRFMAFGIGLMTPVSHPIARALVEGLSHDSLVVYNDARDIYPEIKLIDSDTATKDALTRLHPLKIERIWDDGEGRTRTLKHEGFFIDHREIKVDAEPGKVFDTITNFIMRRFIVDAVEPDHLLLLRSQRKAPGEGWIEWRVSRIAPLRGLRNPTCTKLTQTIYFTPRGLGGFLYWYLLYPIHAIVFRRLLKRIARNSVVK